MNILFLCVANSARSQIAEGIATARFPGHRFVSAGSQPALLVHPMAIEVLSEIGINISQQKPKQIASFDTHFLQMLNCVITLCAEEVCPVLPGNIEKLHWPLPDPAAGGGNIKAFRATRDELIRRLSEFSKRLV